MKHIHGLWLTTPYVARLPSRTYVVLEYIKHLDRPAVPGGLLTLVKSSSYYVHYLPTSALVLECEGPTRMQQRRGIIVETTSRQCRPQQAPLSHTLEGAAAVDKGGQSSHLVTY